MSLAVAELRQRGLLSAHITAGPAYGGERDVLTTAGALQHGFASGHWHAAVCAPGPGVVDSDTLLGHGGMVALESAHTAAALGCSVVVAQRGPSHQARIMLELALVPLIVAMAGGRAERGLARHDWRRGEADLDGYLASGLPARGLEHPDVFASAGTCSLTSRATRWCRRKNASPGRRNQRSCAPFTLRRGGGGRLGGR